MLKKLYLNFFHKKHKFVSEITEANVASITCGRSGEAVYSSNRVKRETLTCKICGYSERKDKVIEKLF